MIEDRRPRHSDWFWEHELNLDVLDAQGGLPTDERSLVWRLLDMLAANAITFVLLLGAFALVGATR